MTPRRRGFTLLEVLVVVAICSVLLALVLCGVQAARLSAARVKCANHLRQLGLALHHYHDTHAHFPPGWSTRNRLLFDLMSWHSRILPFAEQEPLWRQVEKAYKQNSFPRRGPEHENTFRTVVPLFICPMTSETTSTALFEAAFTTYLGVGGTDLWSYDGVLFADSRIRTADVTDGLSHTTMVGERPPGSTRKLSFWYGFGNVFAGAGESYLGEWELYLGTSAVLGPCDFWDNRFRQGRLNDPCDDLHFWSLHPGGAHFLFADGSVRLLTYSIGVIDRTGGGRSSIARALATRAGGEAVELP